MDINNLMENVRAFFSGQYKGVENSNSFISFEPLGSMIDPSDFMDDNNALSDLKAIEQLSILGDRLPHIEEVFIPDTGRLSSAYETLIESAVFSGAKIIAEDKSSYIARFSEEKSEALLKLDEGRKASINMPEGSYLPVYGFPKKWYDISSPFWVNKTFSATETPPPSTPAPPPGKRPFLGWRTKLMVDPQTLITPDISASPAVTQSAKLNIPLRARFQRVNRPLNVATTIRPIALNATVNPVAVKPSMEMRNLNLLNKINFSDRIRVTQQLVKDDTANVAPVHSNAFSMSFDYCLVYLERPWFNTSLFTFSNMWYSLSLQENFFSNGIKDESNNGILKCIPTAMILIKNLKITAAWTDDDKANAKNSISLGVFNLNNSEFIDNALITPGMQIIGWMCEVLPKLPAQGDPNIIS
ncbi:hypothetical protein SAMN05428988_0586 [Chitinophaga sp. YR573]|uniref:hypothetical protein n=1 Tax=Chitinophaga sp. YR573 TaxID=1881040 RepID=UPI0008CC2012|nr:hypothetical protein [Chitinophaga sp. YR573]SEV93480.1 hypothetical protein SAMN05428988_0586 [Chitinophaga sp. YR573]